MKSATVAWALFLFAASQARADELTMIRLGGTPAEVGQTWGRINKRAIACEIDVHFLQKAAAAKLSPQTLIDRSQAFIGIVEELAPHWLEESRAAARAAGVSEDQYIALIAGGPRNLFLHECTSYAVSGDLAGGAILFHKNRDNVEKEQSAFVLTSSVPGVNKFIAVSDASMIGCSMMVNEKGLAASADYPVDLTRKEDPSALCPEAAPPRYRGMMNSSLLRYIAEKAANCKEALEIIEAFVNKGYYAGGDVNGTHWLFVDREGTILEVSNNASHVVSRVHSQKVYFSRLESSAAARKLRETGSPLDFQRFHSVSRNPSICFGSSISGMTVEIDPAHPDRLTCAWISLPARGISFPLLMAQAKTPTCLLNGEAYLLGRKIKDRTPLWESVEQAAHSSKELLKESLLATDSGGHAAPLADRAERWSRQQAEMLVEILRPVR
ncbi:MAG: hypothetical protein GXY83_22190 [Rhodopirellula sp.]|nr:hypothetical protein [Rhodopirellula sp.]